MQGLKKMVVRGYARNGEVRGITILYDQAMEPTGDPLVAPISSAYVPFPSNITVASAADAPRPVQSIGTDALRLLRGRLSVRRVLGGGPAGQELDRVVLRRVWLGGEDGEGVVAACVDAGDPVFAELQGDHVALLHAGLRGGAVGALHHQAARADFARPVPRQAWRKVRCS